MKLFRFFDFILESNEDILLPTIFSKRFSDKISKIDSPISKKFKEDSTFKRIMSKFCYVDCGDQIDTIKYTDAHKVDKILRDTYKSFKDFDTSLYITAKGSRVDDDDWTKNRTEVKVGRFIRKFFIYFTDKEIEEFVNKWKSLNEDGVFELWSGEKIIDGYNSQNYAYDENTSNYSNPLVNSCMNDQEGLIEFYQYSSSAKLLVLLDDNKHILGRSLIWTDYENRIIMDRVYYIHDRDYHKFFSYATSNKWYIKYSNRSGSSEFINPKNGELIPLLTKVKVPNVFKWPKLYGFPYMDTFYYTQDEWAMNYVPSGRYFKL